MDEHQRREVTTPTIPEVSRRVVMRGVLGTSAVAAMIAAGWAVERTYAQDATPAASPAMEAEPNALIAIYGPPTDPAAFEAYYQETHVPLAQQIPGLVELVGIQLLGTAEGGAAEDYRIAILRFPGRAELEAALASPELQEAVADFSNFVTGGVTTVFARLESFPPADGVATPTA